MKAIGTAVRAAAISISSKMYSYMLMVRAIVIKTTTVLDKFLHHLRFCDFSQPLKRYDSRTKLAGPICSG